MENEKLINRLIKLHALATNNPNAEEGKTAAGLLEKLLRENNLTAADIEDDKIEFRVIKTGRDDIHDISVGVVQSEGLACYNLPKNKRRDTCVAFYGTKIQEAEIRNKIDFYCAEYKRQKDMFVIAFMSRNQLFTPVENGAEKPPAKDFTEYEQEIANMARGLTRSQYKKQIE